LENSKKQPIILTASNDLDEYLLNVHNCHDDSTCLISMGSVAFSCHNGFSVDGVVWSDVDKCSNTSFNKCHPKANCSNLHGSLLAVVIEDTVEMALSAMARQTVIFGKLKYYFLRKLLEHRLFVFAAQSSESQS